MKTTIVAELGVNHNGDVTTAIEMVRAAALAGADAIKVQHFSASEFCTDEATYKGEKQVDLFRRYELPLSGLAAIAEECRLQGVEFFGTPDSVEHAKELIGLGATRIKVGSDDLTNIPLLEALAALGKPMVLSTGMGADIEIEAAAKLVCGHPDSSLGDDALILMHCVSEYPTPVTRANLRRMRGIRPEWLPVGYSDHTDGIEAAVLSVALGAVMVEKHFTLSRSMEGPDHAFSADQPQFAEMVRRIRQAEELLGDGVVDPGPAEMEMRKVARRSIVAARPLAAGSMIEPEHLAYKRPGTGLSPARFREILWQVLTRDLDADEQFREGDWR
jgi:N,N'-diacetyllegionaminate synthase